MSNRDYLMGMLRSMTIDNGTKVLLRANGQSDAQHGIDRETGWREIAGQCGFDPYDNRTAAYEDYMEGYAEQKNKGRQ